MAEAAHTAVVYFAGHGIEVDGLNRLIPVDADLDHVIRVPDETVPLNRVQQAVQGAQGLRVVILDACRDNPFIERMRGVSRGREAGAWSRLPLEQEPNRSVGQGLAAPKGISGMLVAYAADAGQKAKDGPADGNSPFAAALVEALRAEPHLDVRFLFGKVRDEVVRRTGGTQEPAIYGQLGGGTYALGPMPSPLAKKLPSTDPPTGVDEKVIEHHRWIALAERAKSDRVDRVFFDAERFLQRFPTGEYAIDAFRIFQSCVDRIEATDLLEKFECEFGTSARISYVAGRLARLRLVHEEAAEAARLRAEAEARANAEEELRQREASNWAWAEQENTVDAYARFLAAWPYGRFTGAAQARIKAIKDAETTQARKGKFRVLVGLKGKEQERWLAPGETAPKDAQFAPEMVLVPPGTYLQGDETKPVDGIKRREVTIGYPLLVGKYPVTFDEWEAGVKMGGVTHKPGDEGWGGGRRPVINVSWHDAQAYAAWLSQATGKTYRLLSEAEWEYACRAGTETAYSFGAEISKQQAHFSEGGFGRAKQTVEVGRFPANAFGLHDMHGNVWEWCEDAWADNYRSAPTDGTARKSDDPTVSRVLRGGSWDIVPRLLRSAYRLWVQPDYRVIYIGFRLARTLHP